MKGSRTPSSIRKRLAEADDCASRFLWGAEGHVSLQQVISGTGLNGGIRELFGKSVLIAPGNQLAAALAMIELDGVARRLVICPPGIPVEHLPAIANDAEAEAVVVEAGTSWPEKHCNLQMFFTGPLTNCGPEIELPQHQSEWILLTSGTTGEPKLVVHNLASLTSPIRVPPNADRSIVWGTFYDIRRYGGLQIFLRALFGGGSLVLTHPKESTNDHLRRLASHGVTHINGTPSHWRRTLMSTMRREIEPRYIRLSGEISDQAIIDALRMSYPHSSISHTFASTEAGVAFEVSDELEGFPASFIGATPEVELKVENSSLHIRSQRTASDYLGTNAGSLKDSAGFIDTGDVVEYRNGRYYFLGRKSGVINVGGLKVFPEEVEAKINQHPAVRMSCVRPRRSPITGSIVIADIVLRDDCKQAERKLPELEEDILKICREGLPRHKVPVKLHFVSQVSVSATGKMSRTNG